MDTLLELNTAERWARVEPGMVRDQLNQQLRPHGLHFAPDPATGDRATVGGMIGNNSSGTHSILYGMTIDHVLEAKVALADGTVLHLKPEDAATWEANSTGDAPGARIRRGFKALIDEHRDEIAARYPKVMRRVSGYNLDAYLDPEKPWNLATLIVGSEGTLGVLLEAKVRLEPLPKATAVCVAHFADLRESLEAVSPILGHSPAAVELIDGGIMAEALRNRATAALAADFVEGEPASILIVEFFGDTPAEVEARAHRVADELRSQGRGYAWPVRTEPERQARVWTVRKLALGLASNVPGPRKRQAFVEDACVPVESLPDYIMQVLAFCREYDAPVSVYGHASVGVLHVEPMLDLHLPGDVARMRSISERVFGLVVALGGSWSGEHGDGLVRGEYLPRFFGPRLSAAFGGVKRLFDPAGLMNPGKLVAPPPMTAHLRYGGGYRLAEVPSQQHHYREQGGLAAAVEQCNGVGACRRLGGGTMCPSYRATRDEAHTTRGRANALRLALSGQVPGGLASDALHEVLSLCLACKACKAECPNAVDLARLKGEALQARHDEKGVPLGARLVAGLPAAAPWLAGPAAPWVNRLQARPGVRALLERAAGLDRRRSLPPFASRPLRRLPSNPKLETRNPEPPRVALFLDTFTRYFEPEIGRAAVRLLEGLGYAVEEAGAGCCQRPAVSQGLLRRAKRRGGRTLRRLDEYVAAGVPVLTLEPGCHSALVDDLPDLEPDAALARRVAAGVAPLEVFLAAELAAGRADAGRLGSPCARVLVHAHCHAQALGAAGAVPAVLGRVPGLAVEPVDAGCCGMAGAFGYRHYELSLEVGGERLFPAVRNRPEGAVVVAGGTSCRHQLADACGVRARHWAEVVRARPAG